MVGSEVTIYLHKLRKTHECVHVASFNTLFDEVNGAKNDAGC